MLRKDERRRHIAISAGIPFLTFLSGIVVQLVFDKFSSKILTTADRIIICVLIGAIIILVVLALLTASESRERSRSQTSTRSAGSAARAALAGRAPIAPGPAIARPLKSGAPRSHPVLRCPGAAITTIR